MEIPDKWIIRRINTSEIESALEFIISMLGEVYSNIPDVAVRWDLAHMEDAYIKPNHSAMFAAFDSSGKIVGTIAIQPYDDRISVVQGAYDVSTTAELSRCYVATALRRQGIAAQLVAAIEDYCWNYGYKTICLHTHKFLSGGFPFWVSQKYGIRLDQCDELETVYLDKALG